MVSGQVRPWASDLFCGLGGWTKGLLAAGYDVTGFDITRHVYGEKRYPAQLVLQNALTIHGSQLRNASIIVASPPCQAYSYLAMPWSRSKCPLCKGTKVYFEWQLIKGVAPGHMTEWGRPIACDCKENSAAAKALRKKWETEGPDNRLFDACFRIQREAIQATRCDCGHESEDHYYGSEECLKCSCVAHKGSRYIPLIVENVRGAIPWVGPSKANYGSFHLWGDVEKIGNRIFVKGGAQFGGGLRVPSRPQKGYGSTWFGIQNNGDRYDQRDVNPVSGSNKVPGFRFDGSGRSFQTDGTDHPTGSWFRIADSSQGDRGVKVPTEGGGRRTTPGSGARFTSRDCGTEAAATKQGGDWFGDMNGIAKHSGRSNARKAASAMIAEIPFPLAEFIGRSYYPLGQDGRLPGAAGNSVKNIPLEHQLR